MGYVVKMPKLGLEMEQGTLLEWYIKEGDPIEEGETIAEIESEKSIGEIDAREDGVLRVAHLDKGETVPPGAPIGIVAAADEDITDLEAQFDDSEESSTAEAEVSDTDSSDRAESRDDESASDKGREATESDIKASPKAKRRAEELDVALAGIDGSGPQGAITADDVDASATTSEESEASAAQVKASPRAKRSAEELGIDLTSIEGTGPQGAITVADVEDAAEAESEEADPSSESQRIAAVESSQMDKSHQLFDHSTLVTYRDEADALLEATKIVSNALSIDLTPTEALVLAVSAALEENPMLNATFVDGTHHLHEYQHIEVKSTDGNDFVYSSSSSGEQKRFADMVGSSHEEGDDEEDRTIDSDPTFIVTDQNSHENAHETIAPPTVAGLVVDCSCRRAVPTESGVNLHRYLRLSLVYDTRAVGDIESEALLQSVVENIERIPELALETYR